MGLILLIVLFSALVIADVVFFSLEKYEYSIAIMVASLVGAFFLVPSIHEYAHGSWLVILTKYLPAFLVAGLVVATGKWIQYNFKRAATITDSKKEFDVKYPADKEHLSDDQVIARREETRRFEENHTRWELRKNRMSIPGATVIGGGGNEKDEEPQAPKYEPLAPAVAAANRRRAFVQFYSNATPRTHKVYTADFSKAESVVDALTPRAKDNVGLITIWIFQWPIVIIDTLITDLLVKLGKHAARVFDAMFSYFSRKLVAHATKGL